MSREKQIEEMAKFIDEFTEPLSARDIHKADFSEQFAERLYNADYRKQSEVAREIFEELGTVLFVDGFDGGRRNLVIMTARDFEAIKNKYMEGQT